MGGLPLWSSVLCRKGSVMRYLLAKESGEVVMQVGRDHPMSWNTRADVDAWIDMHLKVMGGLDWRVGYLFKGKNDWVPLQIVHAKTGKVVKFA